MNIRLHVPPAGFVVAALSVALAATMSGCTADTSIAQPQVRPALNWGACDEPFPNYLSTMGIASSVTNAMQCAAVSVPLDYNDPEGRHINLAISRPRTNSETTRSLFQNPGGPGLEGRSMPALVTSIAQFPPETELIGFDVRGTGASETHSCPELDNLQPPDIADPESADFVILMTSSSGTTTSVRIT